MKNYLFIFSFSILGFIVNGQTRLFTELKKQVALSNPEISLENKLIACNVWSTEEMESREANKSFEKTYSVYEHARLKGGSKGIIVLAINKNELSSDAVITLNKDGITKLISVKLSDVKGLETGVKNIVFDSNGNEVYRNLPSQDVFESVHHLITR